MKPDIHPDYHEITVVMTGGTGFKTRSVRGNAGDPLKLDIDPTTHPAWTGVRRPVDSGGPLARSSKRFKDFGLTGRGIPIVEETKSVCGRRVPFPFPRPRTLRTIGPTARIKAACADR